MVAPGNIILLNGASSSGKSTLARHCQDLLEQPFLHLSSDQLVDGGALPRRRDATGPFAWPEHLRPLFFDGFHRCIPAMASAGNNLLVDHIIEYPAAPPARGPPQRLRRLPRRGALRR